MRRIAFIFLTLYLYQYSLFAQQENHFFIPKAMSFETQLILRGEKEDRGGIGMNLIIGTVHRYKPTSRFRFTPSIEYGGVSWIDRSDVSKSNSYLSLNVAAQYDVIRIKNFSIPFNFGLILDASFKQDERMIFNDAFRLAYSFRIESQKSRTAFEFLGMGITLATGINQNGVDFGAFYFAIIKVEFKF